MTEYIIIVVLLAIALIGVVGFFGNRLRGLFGIGSDALTGDTNAQSTTGPANTNWGAVQGPGLRMGKEQGASGGVDNAGSPGADK
jgi:Flp pilus assembly pilin Flp